MDDDADKVATFVRGKLTAEERAKIQAPAVCPSVARCYRAADCQNPAACIALQSRQRWERILLIALLLAAGALLLAAAVGLYRWVGW